MKDNFISAGAQFKAAPWRQGRGNEQVWREEARYTMDYPTDVSAYGAVCTHLLTMSDALSDGIVKQFPVMFGK